MSIRNMRLKLGKNEETFKKHRQAEFLILASKNCFNRKFLIKLARKENDHPLHASQNLSILFLASQLPNMGFLLSSKVLKCKRLLRNISGWI